jgi:hypothetical protein
MLVFAYPRPSAFIGGSIVLDVTEIILSPRRDQLRN